MRIRRAFEGSWKALIATGEGLAVAVVAVAPWVAVIGVPGFAFVSFLRRRRNR